MCESLALFGLILRFRGSPVAASVPYYVGGFILLLFFWPRQTGERLIFPRRDMMVLEVIACRSTTQENWRECAAAGAIVRRMLEAMKAQVRPGVTTAELDEVGARVMREQGAQSAPALVVWISWRELYQS